MSQRDIHISTGGGSTVNVIFLSEKLDVEEIINLLGQRFGTEKINIIKYERVSK